MEVVLFGDVVYSTAGDGGVPGVVLCMVAVG